MAAVTLAPWPSAANDVTAALACLRGAGIGVQAEDDRLTAIAEAAAETVERYAPGAPQAIKNEATIRFAGWIATAVRGDIFPAKVGDLTFEWRPTFDRAGFRQSGARALLRPWHRPRATPLWSDE